jgi:hypothetical protein
MTPNSSRTVFANSSVARRPGSAFPKAVTMDSSSAAKAGRKGTSLGAATHHHHTTEEAHRHTTTLQPRHDTPRHHLPLATPTLSAKRTHWALQKARAGLQNAVVSGLYHLFVIVHSLTTTPWARKEGVGRRGVGVGGEGSITHGGRGSH